MAINTQTIRIDLNTGRTIPVAFAHQNDTNRQLTFQLYNNGVAFTPSSTTVKFAYKSPIVNGRYSVITGSQMASGTVSGNTVTVTLPNTYTQVHGVGLLTMILTTSGNTLRPVNIKFVVQSSADGDDVVLGASDWPEGLYDYMDNWLEENEPTEIANLKSDLSNSGIYTLNRVAFTNRENVGIYKDGNNYRVGGVTGYSTAQKRLESGKHYKVSISGIPSARIAYGNSESGTVYDSTMIDGATTITNPNSYTYLFVMYKTASYPDGSVTFDEIEYTISKIEEQINTTFASIASKATFTDGSYIVGNPNSSDYGRIFTGSTYYALSSYIPINGIEKLAITIGTVSLSGDVGAVVYDKDYNKIGGYRNTQAAPTYRNETKEIELPSGAYYIRTTIYKDTDTKGEFVCNAVGTPAQINGYNRIGIDTVKSASAFMRSYIVAASDSSETVKMLADYVCDGVNDEVEIQTALNRIGNNIGEVVLTEGTYNIDSFSTYDNELIAITLTLDVDIGTYQKTIRGVGRRTNKKTVVNVTSTALSQVGTNTASVFGSHGYRYGQIGVFKDFIVILADNQHKITAINNTKLSGGKVEQVSLRAIPTSVTDTNIPMPVTDCVGLTGYAGDSVGTFNFMKEVYATGFYEAYRLAGEHLIAMNLSGRYNYITYTFGNYDWIEGQQAHPLTLINCCDESSACLPKFYASGTRGGTNKAKQEVDFIGFNMELDRPTNFGGGLVMPAEDLSNGGFCGRIDFVGYGNPNDGRGVLVDSAKSNQPNIKFWADGSGELFRTTNMVHERKGTTANRGLFYPMFMQEYFDTDENKMLVFDGTNWIDMIGNIVT